MKSIVTITGVALTVIAAALALWQMREATQLLILSLALASGLEPVVAGQERRGLPRHWAITFSMGVVLVYLGLSGAILGPLAYADLFAAIDAVPAWYDASRHALLTYPSWDDLAIALPPSSSLARSFAAEQFTALAGLIFSITNNLLYWAVALFSALAISFYWLSARARIERLWLSLLPIQVRVPIRDAWHAVYNEVGLYVRSVTVLGSLYAFSLIAVYVLLGLPGSVLLGLIGGLAQILPVLSLPLALLPGVIIGFSQGPITGMLVLSLGLVALGFIEHWIKPRILQGGITINPVLVVLLIMALADLGGVAMILLAPPLAAAIQTISRVLITEQRISTAQTSGVYSEVEDRLVILELRASDGHNDDPQLQALLARARKLLDNFQEKVVE